MLSVIWLHRRKHPVVSTHICITNGVFELICRETILIGGLHCDLWTLRGHIFMSMRALADFCSCKTTASTKQNLRLSIPVFTQGCAQRLRRAVSLSARDLLLIKKV